jgi:hypothetical protein
MDPLDDPSPTEATPPTAAPAASPERKSAAGPSPRYDATVRLIRSRLADAARSQAKSWWKPWSTG